MQKVIAIDFDGTLCENKYPEIGLPRWGVIFKALSEQENGAALILWTCRTGKELNAANKRFRPFASPHEGQNIVREELEEVEQALVPLKLHIETRMWNAVKANKTIPQEELHEIREMAIHLAVEAIQVAAMVKKFEHGQHRGWPGGKTLDSGTESVSLKEKGREAV